MARKKTEKSGLNSLPGVGAATVAKLMAANLSTVAKVASSTPGSLKKAGLSPSMATKVLKAAQGVAIVETNVKAAGASVKEKAKAAKEQFLKDGGLVTKDNFKNLCSEIYGEKNVQCDEAELLQKVENLDKSLKELPIAQLLDHGNNPARIRWEPFIKALVYIGFNDLKLQKEEKKK